MTFTPLPNSLCIFRVSQVTMFAHYGDPSARLSKKDMHIRPAQLEPGGAVEVFSLLTVMKKPRSSLKVKQK